MEMPSEADIGKTYVRKLDNVEVKLISVNRKSVVIRYKGSKLTNIITKREFEESYCEQS